MNTTKTNIETLTGASKEVGLEVNAEKTKYMLIRSKSLGRWYINTNSFLVVISRLTCNLLFKPFKSFKR
jgi:hypothetical protein